MKSGILSPGDNLRIGSSVKCRVEELLGAGGQGEVYRVTIQGASFALKWYYPETATGSQFETLRVLIEKGTPDTRFLWPTDLLVEKSKPNFGYLMALRAPRFRGISDLLTRRVSSSMRSIVTACINLSDAFLQLHAEGLCYRDISSGNVFFDPDSGDVLICDNDNVGVNGGPTSVLGTPRFMAPEVVRREELPSTQTDLFSLAVLLFLILMNGYPLDGRKEAAIHCFDFAAMVHLYGQEPVFVFDPDDESNRPVEGLHKNVLDFWPLYPAFLRSLFVKSFTDGLRDPVYGRVRETTWRGDLRRLRDSILLCACGAENFYDAEGLKAAGGVMGNCWSCGLPLVLPPRIRIVKPNRSSIVMLNPDSKLFSYHLSDDDAEDVTKALADVSRHPTDATRLGLRNLTDEDWTANLADGSVRVISPGKSLALASGTHIYFGRAEGEIRM